jgi:hypothetical protein
VKPASAVLGAAATFASASYLLISDEGIKLDILAHFHPTRREDFHVS